jgi:hypothetical protein
MISALVIFNLVKAKIHKFLASIWQVDKALKLTNYRQSL